MAAKGSGRERSELQAVEQRSWYLYLSALFLILLLTLSLLIYFMPQMLELDLSRTQNPETLSKELGLLGFLLLIYTIYSFWKQRELRILRSQLVRKEAEMEGISLRLSELTSIFEVIASISSYGELHKVFDLIVRHVCITLKADSCSLLLVEEGSDYLLPISSFGGNADLVAKSHIRFGEGIAGWVVEEGKPLLLNSDDDIARFKDVPEKVQSIASAMSYPLTLDGKVIGVLNINRFSDKDKFTDGDFKLIQIFAHDAAVAIRSTRLMEENKQKGILEEKNRLLTKFLKGYVPDWVATKMLENPDRYLRLEGEKRDLTILFADIRGFTRFAEKNEAEKVVEILNKTFTELTKVVFAHNGYINKFIGDCLLAIYDKEFAGGDEVLMALKTGAEMQRVFMRILEETRLSQELGLGIGINSGEVIIGNIGSEDLMDYTVIGDSVNVATLLQEKAKAFQVLMGKSTYLRMQDRIEARRLPSLVVKGRVREIEVYELMDIKDDA